MKNIKRIFWLLLGCISMGIGAVGVVLPILPTFPFLLLALFGFAKSSVKMENWFRSTGLYRKHLKPLMEKKTMSRKTKITVILSMTLFMGIGFWFMDSVPVGRIILALVWLFHMIYFTKGIRTAAAGEV
ncbi:MAG TPA: YbaN family protein [Candidatus Blautia stercoravium]|nr:YbaN family protein [Candidatus Blautia stercoravium]